MDVCVCVSGGEGGYLGHYNQQTPNKFTILKIQIWKFGVSKNSRATVKGTRV